jgi:signal transduction histidine kinase
MLKKGIKTKLILSLVLTILVVMISYFILLDRFLKAHTIKETENTIFFLGQNASSLLLTPVFYQDYNQLENIARPLILADFDYLLIYDTFTHNIAFKEDKTATGVADSLPLETILKDKTDFEKMKLDLNGSHYTQYLFPVNAAGFTRPLGFLIIGTSVERMEMKLEKITQRILLITVLLFLTLTFTVYLLADKLVKPLKRLSEKIEIFASGNYAVRSDIKTNDEIRVLSDNFNILADKINDQILSIEQYSKNLEKMVEERTKELLKALDAIKEKDKKLNQAEKISSLNSIVSSIAHEINNPLTIISGNLQMLEVRLENPQLRRKLDTAEDAIQRIANLIDEINFFSAIKNISFSWFSFTNLLTAVVGKVVPGTIPITIQGVEDDRIYSNPNLLTISLENILGNSVEVIQARKIKGNIHVRYTRDAPSFTLEISDNGGGLDEPQKAFDPFYTTFSQRKGLGLTFVYHAIQALNGEVTIENIETGAAGETEKGAKVTVWLSVDVPDVTEVPDLPDVSPEAKS